MAISSETDVGLIVSALQLMDNYLIYEFRIARLIFRCGKIRLSVKDVETDPSEYSDQQRNDCDRFIT